MTAKALVVATDLEQARKKMIERDLAGRDITDPRVLDAMRRIPRHEFVSEELRSAAYRDDPLPIEAAQSISQPYIVALMTQLLNLNSTDRVLEVGVGSGYQSAVLAEIAHEVIGIERIPELADQARAQLQAIGYTNVTIHTGDGTEGCAENAPFDAILVAAAAPLLPEPLINQLADGGRLVIPISFDNQQYLECITRRGETLHIEKLTPVRFVPLIGKYGYPE